MVSEISAKPMYSQYIGTWLIFGFLAEYPNFSYSKISAYLTQSTKSPIAYSVITPNKFSAFPDFAT